MMCPSHAGCGTCRPVRILSSESLGFSFLVMLPMNCGTSLFQVVGELWLLGFSGIYKQLMY